MSLLSSPQFGDLPRYERQRGGERDYTQYDNDVTRISSGSRRSNADEDFQALKNEALRHLSAKQQQRSTIIPSPQGSGVIIRDVKKLDRRATREIIDKVYSIQASTAEDNEQEQKSILQRTKERFARVGLQQPTIIVRFRNISVYANITIDSKQLPTISGPFQSYLVQPILRKLLPSRALPIIKHSIIQNSSGILHPGRFTLLLGAPQSGKTTLLRTLAGLTTTNRHGMHVTYDELTYNGYSLSEFVPQRSLAYISQVDLHYGELTVRETFDFSRRCQGSGHRVELLQELLEREKKMGIDVDPLLDTYMRGIAHAGKHSLIVELIIRILQLDSCQDTVVGSAMLRGISGGQKKRVTSGEVMVGPARALFADEISTGLDSSTTCTIISALRNYTHIMSATVLIGLLQPAPEVFDLFDDVILLSAGKILFHGPIDTVLPFFESSIGFFVPQQKGIADFLVEVALPGDQQKYYNRNSSQPYKYITPTTIQQLYMNTPIALHMTQELSQPYQCSASNCDMKTRALAWTPYGQKFTVLLRALVRRTFILQRRTKLFAIIRTFQVGWMALIVSTLFWREDKNTVEDGNLFLGVIFYSLLYQLLGGVSEMHLMCDRLPVAHKQIAMRFYPGFLFAIVVFMFRVPYSFVESTLWTMLVYWIVGFSPSVRFLVFWAVMFLINAWSVLLFQVIAAICRDDTVATAVGSFFLLIFINISGFVINAGSVPGWWQEGLWANPFFYAMRALSINEFTSSDWNKPSLINPSASTLGTDILHFRGFPTSYYWVWIAFGFIIITGILNFCVFVAALTWLGERRRRVVMPMETYKETVMMQEKKSSFVVVAMPPASSVILSRREGGGGGGGRMGVEDRDHSMIDGGIGGCDHYNTTNTNTNAINQIPSSISHYHSHTTLLPSASASASASERLSFSTQAAADYRKRTAIPYPELVLTFRNLEYSVPLPKNTTDTTTNNNNNTTTNNNNRSDEAVIDNTITTSTTTVTHNDNDINNNTNPHAGQLQLLQKISGCWRPGICTALMGASGAGKTTLMDCLAGRKTEGIITGDIRVNGHPKDQATFARVSGYVEQTDVHLPQTSVKEALQFSATLRLQQSVTKQTRDAFVDEILELVELDTIANAFVGVPGVSGLNIEQRKRLTMAVELVACPSIIFLDEPTSGLDARAANVVMMAIRNTVDSGRTVVCTIHQPSIDIFESFDELLLLKPGGQTIYCGPLGENAQQLIAYFQSIHGVKQIKPRYNPANWMLEVTNTSNEQRLGVDFAQVYKNSAVRREMDAFITKFETPTDQPLTLSELHVAPWSLQFTTNFMRFWRQYKRMPEYNFTRLLVTIAVALVFGTLFWRQGNKSNTVTGVLNIAGVLFGSTLFIGITDCLMVQHVTSAQRSVMYRERAAGYYSVLPFALAQQLVEVPYLIVQTILYSSIVYWMVYFAVDAGKFFLFMLFFLLTLFYFVLFGQMAVALTPAVPLSNVLCSFFFGVWNLLCGFLIPEPQMPAYYKWTYYANPVSWSLYSLSLSQLGDLQNDIVTLQGEVMSISSFLTVFFNWHKSMMWVIVAILLGFACLFSVISIFALMKINYQRR